MIKLTKLEIDGPIYFRQNTNIFLLEKIEFYNNNNFCVGDYLY